MLKEARKIISSNFTNEVVETEIKPLEVYGIKINSIKKIQKPLLYVEKEYNKD
ncbi:hypothetical protein ACP3T3_01315 [Chryseobacterium sp. CBSDS_008]|uniref:hypothetical protein n=1 Tax=Chryseobacterium sp. CBSDS_008 TaxID=3415265 RepID=UPI003CF125DA